MTLSILELAILCETPFPTTPGCSDDRSKVADRVMKRLNTTRYAASEISKALDGLLLNGYVERVNTWKVRRTFEGDVFLKSEAEALIELARGLTK